MGYQLPILPYDYDALAPHIGPQTLEIHYDKHHRAYVDKLNKLTEANIGSEEALRRLIRNSDGDLFNQAAQVWNHSFYWKSMKPNGGGEPGQALADELTSAFGSVERFRAELAEAAKGEFGSGWAWLVQDKSGTLRVMSSSDADNPLRKNFTPLLTIDVWEHAYYLDYKNDRGAYVQTFLERVMNWSFVEDNLKSRVDDMMRQPSEVFDAPSDVLEEPALSIEQQIKLLKKWRYDAVQLQVAAQENLIGDERGAGLIGKIDEALIQLAAK